MSSDRFQRAAELFEHARELAEAQRVALLDEACGDDHELRAEVDSLLKRHDRLRGNDRLEAMREEIRVRADAVTAETVPASTPRTIGRYEIKDVIATGGMGTVYRAVQDHPRRIVALKVLRHGAASSQAIRRFRHEAEILGRLKHPNIAQVHDAGTFDEGQGAQPFFAMELIDGLPLIRYTESKKLGRRDRLRLFEKVCHAVQYAHHRGVIHRDLKPDNILVDEHGEPKILDFGVARATDADIQMTTLQTDIGQLIGTIPYMSPEQVSGDPEQLDTRSDVYSLGVVAYELLTGRMPHELADKTIPEAVRIIGQEDPRRLSTVDRALRGDLDTIVAKALERDRKRRYQSAGELGTDIGHYLADKPITARPVSTFYQLRKFTRRNRVLVGGVAAVFVVMAAGLIGIGIALAQAKDEAVRSARIKLFLEEMLVSPDPFASGDKDLTVIELLDQSVERIDEQFADDPEVAMSLHLTVGRTYRGLGRYRDAEEEAQRAYDLGREWLGPDHLETLAALLLLADAIAEQERFEEAVPLARLHHERRLRVRGASHPETLEAVAYLGMVLSWSLLDSDRIEGIRLLTGIHNTYSETLEPDHAKKISVAWNLGNALLRQCRFAEAEPYLRNAYDRCRQQPERSIECNYLALDLAMIVGLTGKPEDGILIAEDSYKRLLEELGPNHAITLVGLYCLGLNLQWSQRTEEAERRFREFVVRAEENGDGFTLSPLLLARLQLIEGKMSPADALPIIERFVERDANPSSIRGEWGLTALARCLVDLGKYEEAHAVMQRNPGRLAGAVAKDHFERRLYLETLAAINEGLGQPGRAREYRALLRAAELLTPPPEP